MLSIQFRGPERDRGSRRRDPIRQFNGRLLKTIYNLTRSKPTTLLQQLLTPESRHAGNMRSCHACSAIGREPSSQSRRHDAEARSGNAGSRIGKWSDEVRFRRSLGIYPERRNGEKELGSRRRRDVDTEFGIQVAPARSFEATHKSRNPSDRHRTRRRHIRVRRDLR